MSYPTGEPSSEPAAARFAGPTRTGIPANFPSGDAVRDAGLRAPSERVRRMLLKLTGQGVTNNIKTDAGNKPATWNEIARATEKIRIFQNNDTSSPNYVDVDQINSLTMQDKNSKQTWKWTR